MPLDISRLDALTSTLQDTDTISRHAVFTAWQTAPGAFAAHPHSAHLTPIFVAVGSAEHERAQRTFHDELHGIAYSEFRCGA